MKLLLITIFLTGIYTQDDRPLLEISNGLLEGTYDTSYNGRTFSSFEGIPYAKPPVDDLRFEGPTEPYNWTGTWMANTKHTCLQVEFTKVLGDEDCLYLNVYVPRTILSSLDKLNVIVHIHGGGFTMMSAHSYAGPKYLMDEDVILVTINYRLGPFGFLSTEDDVVSGNNGMKDQVLALKWIQKNIKYFGGNPESVTITGMSAGAASVHLHYFSHLSEGLFHRGISQSGTALAPWVFQKTPLENAKRLAKLLGCPNYISEELKRCLKSRPGVKIVQATKFGPNIFDTINFTPVVEKEHPEAFITAHPLQILTTANIVADLPWITSVAENEGSIFSSLLPKEILTEDYFDKFASRLLYYSGNNDEQAITKKIKQHYFTEHPLNEDTLTTILSDRMFLASVDDSIKLQAKINQSPVYFYILRYRGQHTFADYFMKNTSHIEQATHGDDVLYYLHSSISENKLSDNDENMKYHFLQWIVSYANNRELKVNNVHWKPVSGSQTTEFLYFEDSDEIYEEVAENLGFSTFWHDLLLEENENYVSTKDEL